MAGGRSLGGTSVVSAGPPDPLDPLEPLIRVQGFEKRYGKRLAVQGVDLQVRRGELYGLIGPDGAGKTSLMKAIAGVLAQDRGTIQVFGISIDSERAAERIKGRIGFMPQGLGLNLYRDLSIEENIAFFAALREVPPALLAERKARLLAMTRLTSARDRPMKFLSGGMKQKLGLICTLIHEPELVILDEPTTGVDPVSRRDFWAILAELLQERKITALISTAYLDEATRFHRLSLLYEGTVLAQGEPDRLRQRVPGTLIEISGPSQVAILKRLKQPDAQVEALGSLVRVFLEEPDPEAARAQVAARLVGLDIRRIRIREPEFEDTFIALLRRREPSEAATPLPEPERQETESHHRHGIAIAARALTRDFDGFRAVDRVSFQVDQGEIFGLLGANGAGKTTVIKMLTGILPPTEGTGQVAGADLGRGGRAVRERIGYMSQAFSLYQDLTVWENIQLYGRIYGIPRRHRPERIRWILDMAGLAGFEGQLTGRLPMGIRQRLALGCALIHRPRVLFLDEPTSGVDPIGRRRFWEILVRMARGDGVAILVTTHYLTEADHCDHLALMHAGRIVATGTPSGMKASLEREAGRLLEITANRPLAALKRLETAGFPGVSLFGTRIHLLARDPQSAQARIRAQLEAGGIELIRIRPRLPSLEDVFNYQILARERSGAAS